MEKKLCKECGIERNVNNFYLSHETGKEHLDICKDCFFDEINKNIDIQSVFRKYNIPFLIVLWSSLEKSYSGNEIITQYMKCINSFPQYRNLLWKDSVLYDETREKETNFYDEIVTNLQKEAKKLNQKLTNISNNNGDFNNYISILKSLRETLDLISKYDWKLNYSEYDVIKNDNSKQHQISIWYQNHDNQIKDHKFWNVIE